VDVEKEKRVRISRAEDGEGVSVDRYATHTLRFIYRGDIKPYWAPAPAMNGKSMAALERWGLVEYRVLRLDPQNVRLARLTPRGQEVRDAHHRRMARKKSEEPLL
jgi:hypothetical protein